LRILLKTVLDPVQIKDAERIGALFSLVHSALCTQKRMKISRMKTTEYNNMQQMRLYVQVEGDAIMSRDGDICQEAIDLTATMAERGHQVNVVYQTVLNYDHRKVVKFLVYHVSIIPTLEIAFPEKWKVGLQGVIDSLGLANSHVTNFQVPLFHDQITTEERVKGVAEPKMQSSFFSRFTDNIHVEIMLKHLLPALVLGEFHCFPYTHVYGYNDGLFSRVKAFVPKTSIQTPRSSEYSDLALVELFKSTWSELSFSLYTHKDEPTYGLLILRDENLAEPNALFITGNNVRYDVTFVGT
ncbi:hypothetical protein X801_02010, partial [Opisthorchis viverrini]